MAESLPTTAHPAATPHLPSFITAPGETDVLMVVTAIIMLVAVIAFGVVFLRLHTLPERIAHKSHKIQFEIVAVLGLLALFTHMHIFWVAGLLLALIDMPDFGSRSLGRIAGSVETMAGLKPGEGDFDLDTPQKIPETRQPVEHAAAPSEAAHKGDGTPPPGKKPEVVRASRKELGHA